MYALLFHLMRFPIQTIGVHRRERVELLPRNSCRYVVRDVVLVVTSVRQVVGFCNSVLLDARYVPDEVRVEGPLFVFRWILRSSPFLVRGPGPFAIFELEEAVTRGATVQRLGGVVRGGEVERTRQVGGFSVGAMEVGDPFARVASVGAVLSRRGEIRLSVLSQSLAPLAGHVRGDAVLTGSGYRFLLSVQGMVAEVF